MDEHEIKDYLLKRAGLTKEDSLSGPLDSTFDEIAFALCDVRQGKEKLYGNYIENNGGEPEVFCLVQHFCDIKRKFVRAENITKLKSEGKEVDLEHLIDTYADLAVYSMIGIQLIMHLMERNQSE